MGKWNNNTDNEQTWLTPPEIKKPLGEFDLDPATPIDRIWDTAKVHFNKNDDGLAQDWFGRVWLNPPYDKYQISKWMEKMANHGNGISLLFARTSNPTWQDHIFPNATSVLFIRKYLYFYDKNGVRAKYNSGAPSALLAYGDDNADCLEDSGIDGHHLLMKPVTVILMHSSKSWKIIVGKVLERLNGTAKLADVYSAVIRLAPNKVANNSHYQAKVRQVLQEHFTRVDRGVYKN